MTKLDRMLLVYSLFLWREKLIIRHRLDFIQQIHIRNRHRNYYENY